MKKISLFLLLNGIIVCSYAQKNIYSALTIPDSLRRNADVVVREEIIKLTIKDKNTARYEVRKVITIMNEQGKQYLDFYWFSYQFRVLEDAEIKLYDLLGNKKNSYSKKEMNSQNYGEGLVPEGKLTYFSVNAPSFPFTVEVIYAEKYRGVFNLPEYKMQLPWQSVQHSSFEVEVPSDLGVRYKLLNTDNKPLITINGSKESYKWEISDLQAYKLEKHSGSSDNYVPQVLFAPNKFQLDDYEGDMSTWKGFGDWYNSVYLKSLTYAEISGIIHTYRQETNCPEKMSLNISLDEVHEIENSGLVTIGAHTLNHPILKNEDDKSCSAEIAESIKQFEELLQHPVKYFAYPNGRPHIDFGEREIRCLKQNNISMCFSTELDTLSADTNMLSIPRMGFARMGLSPSNPLIYFRLSLGRKWIDIKSVGRQSEKTIREKINAAIGR